MAEHPIIEGWDPPGPAARYSMLERSKSIAIVGASSNPARASNFVATYLLSSSTSFDVYLVNPRETEILGRPVYPSLADMPVVPDIVDVFRRNSDLPGVAQDAVDVDASVFWVQLGLWSEDAALLASQAGLGVVMDRCLKIEHARFHGGLHLAGFNTGVINSHRARHFNRKSGIVTRP